MWQIVPILTVTLLFGTGCALEATRPAGTSLPTTLERIEPGIVQIAVVALGLAPDWKKRLDPAGQVLVLPAGTGFLVNREGYVLTAEHVLTGAYELLGKLSAKRKFLAVGFATKNDETFRANFDIVEFGLNNVIARDVENDVALVKVPDEEFIRTLLERRVEPVRLSLERPANGRSIAVSGYPFRSPVLLTNAGIIGSAWAFGPDMRKGNLDRYLIDATVNQGNSGGPVYFTDSGDVIGVCVAHLTENAIDRNMRPLDARYNAGIVQVIPIKYAIDLMKKNKVNWTGSLH